MIVVFGRIGLYGIPLALESRRLVLVTEESVIAIREVSRGRLQRSAVDFLQSEHLHLFLEGGELF